MFSLTFLHLEGERNGSWLLTPPHLLGLGTVRKVQRCLWWEWGNWGRFTASLHIKPSYQASHRLTRNVTWGERTLVRLSMLRDSCMTCHSFSAVAWAGLTGFYRGSGRWMGCGLISIRPQTSPQSSFLFFNSPLDINWRTSVRQVCCYLGSAQLNQFWRIPLLQPSGCAPGRRRS